MPRLHISQTHPCLVHSCKLNVPCQYYQNMYNLFMDEAEKPVIEPQPGEEGNEAEEVDPINVEGVKPDTKVAPPFAPITNQMLQGKEVSVNSQEGASYLNIAAGEHAARGVMDTGQFKEVVKGNMQRAADAGPAETLPIKTQQNTEPNNPPEDQQ